MAAVVDVQVADISDVTQLKARDLAQRLTIEPETSGTPASIDTTRSIAASVMDVVNGAVAGIERVMRYSRESRNSKEGSVAENSGSRAGSRRPSREGRASKEGKRRKSGEFIDEPTIKLENLSGQRISLFMQELQAELCT